jgi:hypothetical protein
LGAAEIASPFQQNPSAVPECVSENCRRQKISGARKLKLRVQKKLARANKLMRLRNHFWEFRKSSIAEFAAGKPAAVQSGFAERSMELKEQDGITVSCARCRSRSGIRRQNEPESGRLSKQRRSMRRANPAGERPGVNPDCGV